ncbi:hypothetical protein Tco_1526795, partial [Tanacetum coccineum]
MIDGVMQHVPKVNGELPSADEATSDHQRLMDRLQLYDLVELKVSGDGNCQTWQSRPKRVYLGLYGSSSLPDGVSLNTTLNNSLVYLVTCKIVEE